MINLVFVHGFGSGPETWDPLWAHLKALGTVEPIAVPYRFAYDSPVLSINPAEHIPRVKEIGQQFATFLDTLPSRDRANPAVLVGHSQGGLVIQAMIAHRLGNGQTRNLLSIAHCVLIATPNNGSAFLLKTRTAVAKVFQFLNPQEKNLRPLDEYIAGLQRDMAQRVVYSDAVTDRSCPVPFTAVFGTEDGIVPQQSAHWIFPHTEAVSGNHFTVIKPPVRQSRALSAIVERVVEAARHHLPVDIALVRTVPICGDDAELLQDSLAVLNARISAGRAIRKEDAKYWLTHYERRFAIRLRMVAATVNKKVRGFLMFHEDRQRNIAVIDYLVSLSDGLVDRLATKQLVDRLRFLLSESGVQYVVFEVTRPVEGSDTFRSDTARVRLFERYGARVVPNLAYLAPSMTAQLTRDGEEPSLLMVASSGLPLASLPWSQIRGFVDYMYNTWYRNWFSNLPIDKAEAVARYLEELRSRVLTGVPETGAVALSARATSYQ